MARQQVPGGVYNSRVSNRRSNVPWGHPAKQEPRDEHFLDVVRQLEAQTARLGDSRAAARGVALLLSQLFLDGDALFDQVNRGRETKPVFHLRALPEDGHPHATVPEHGSVWATGEGVVRLKRAAFLKHNVARVGGVEVGAKTIIDYVRNVQGGAHAGRPRTPLAELLAESDGDFAAALGSGRLYQLPLRRTSDAALRALGPLRRQVRREAGLTGEDEQSYSQIIERLKSVAAPPPTGQGETAMDFSEPDERYDRTWGQHVDVEEAFAALNGGQLRLYRIGPDHLYLIGSRVVGGSHPHAVVTRAQSFGAAPWMIVSSWRVFPYQDVDLDDLADPTVAFALFLLRFGVRFEDGADTVLFSPRVRVTRDPTLPAPSHPADAFRLPGVRFTESDRISIASSWRPLSSESAEVEWVCIVDLEAYDQEMSARRGSGGS